MKRGKVLLLLGILLTVTDQVIKILVRTNMSIGESIHVFGDWFQILYIENNGMAFGMAFGGMVGKFLLSFFRICLFGALCWWITKLCRQRDLIEKGTLKETLVPVGVLYGLTLITAGALGNIIDSLFYGSIFGYAPFMFGQVVDMFYFPLWVWPEWMPWLGGHVFFEPVFNFADSCVTVGALYLVFFLWKYFSKS